jgi:Protein of unknown function (DUF2478)
VVRGVSSAQVEDVFQALVDRWRPHIRLAGVVAESHGLAERACSAGYLRSITTAQRFQIFSDLGPGSVSCHLDGDGALAAADAVLQDVAAGCDVVLLSKFGKLEAGGKGLFAAFSAAIASHVPLLTSVSRACEEPWREIVGSSFAILAAEPDEIDAWRRAVTTA